LELCEIKRLVKGKRDWLTKNLLSEVRVGRSGRKGKKRGWSASGKGEKMNNAPTNVNVEVLEFKKKERH